MKYYRIQNGSDVSTTCAECVTATPITPTERVISITDHGTCEACGDSKPIHYADALADALTDLGYAVQIQNTGGGCMAVVAQHPDGGHIVANDEGVCRYPAGAWTDGGEAYDDATWWADDPATPLSAYVDTWQRFHAATITA